MRPIPEGIVIGIAGVATGQGSPFKLGGDAK